MTSPKDTQNIFRTQPKVRKSASAFRNLVNIRMSPREPERRRANLMAGLQLSILVLICATIVLVLVLNPPNNLQRNVYVGLITVLIFLISLAYILNRTGHYYMSAGLTVLCTVIGPWGSILLDPAIIQGDFVPLTYITLSIMLSSILLPPLITTVLAASQWVGILILILLNPSRNLINWPSFLAFILFTSVFSILSNLISKRDLAQIDSQTRNLIRSSVKLREQSIRDYLTNLFNRRYMEETLEREIKRAVRQKYPIGIIMLDIDHFKRFNDSLGHAAGDSLLKELGNLLNKNVRGADIACRYGGEEFVLILPGASLEVSKERAELLRNQVKTLQVKHKDQTLKSVSISLGVAVFPKHGSNADVVLKSADDALYRAKHEGRDRVVVAE